MQRFIKIALFFMLTWGQYLYAVPSEVRIEAKEFDGSAYLIFYHHRDQQVVIQPEKNSVVVKLKIPGNFTIQNPNLFYKFATKPVLSASRDVINFELNTKFIKHSLVHGERLEAIKLDLQKVDITELLKELSDLPSSSQSVNNKESKELIIAKSGTGFIKYAYNQEEEMISFDFGVRGIGLALFCRDNFLWIIFDSYKNFELNDNISWIKDSYISNFLQLKSQDSSIFRIKLKDASANVSTSKNNSVWAVHITKKMPANIHKGLILYPQDLADYSGVNIKGNFGNNIVVSVKDPDLGDIIKAIPLKVYGSRVVQKYESEGFTILPSMQGVACIFNNDDTSLVKANDYVQILSSLMLPTGGLHPELSKPEEQEKKKGHSAFYKNNFTLLPVLDRNLDIIDFNKQKLRLINDIATAESLDDLFFTRFELAKFFFIHGFYHECLGTLNLIKLSTINQYNADIFVEFLHAVTSTITGNAEDAKDMYNNLINKTNKEIDNEIVLWNNYNNFLINNNSEIIGVSDNYSKMKVYADNLYWPIVFAELEMSILSNNLKVAEQILRNLREPEGKFLNSINFYKALYYKQKQQPNLSKQLLADLTKQNKDYFNFVRSEIELVKLQKTRKEIDLLSAIKRLNALKTLWRGDKLEYDLLMLIANYYQEAGDNINALRTYKYIQSAFNNALSNFYITSEMVKSFNKLFLSPSFEKEMDDFDAVALFYEFQDLTPIGSQGDDIIISIAKRLIKLDLLESAAKLLQHQIEYRLSGEKRVTTADQLAIIFLMDKKPKEALQILNNTEIDNVKFNEHQYRLRLKARALIDIGKYQDALELLKSDDNPDSIILRKEALFRLEKWSDFVELTTTQLSNIGSDLSPEIEQDILRISIAYYKQNKQLELKELNKALGDKNEYLHSTINLLLTTNVPIDYKNLDKSLNVNQLQAMLNNYKKYLFNE